MIKNAWEYRAMPLLNKTVDKDEKELNSLGLDGWELVSVSTETHHHRGDKIVTTYAIAYFKRQIVVRSEVDELPEGD